MLALILSLALQQAPPLFNPAFTQREVLPAGFAQRADALAFRPGGDLLLCDSADGSIWGLSGVVSGDRAQVHAKRVAAGLDRPSALILVGERLFVLQRQELTELIDLDRDGVADTYSCLCAAWSVGRDAQESAHGLGYADGWFTTTLADGRRIRIALADGHLEDAARGSADFARVAIPKAGGPYAGQFCATDDGLMRERYEEVEGLRQSCLLRFASEAAIAAGPDGALYVGRATSVCRLEYAGAGVLDLLAVRARTNGFELEFSEPLAPGCGWDPALWSAEATKPLSVRSASVSADRKHVELEIAGLAEGQLVHLQALGPLPSEQGARAWNSEAWYDLARLPKEQPVVPRAQPRLEPEPDWKPLSWRGYKQADMPARGWVVEDGALVCKGGGGDLVSREEYADFELRLEWKISPGGNSGILFHASEDHDNVWESAPEMQILDDARHPDGKNPKTSAGSNYALLAPPPGTTRPVGCWNEVRLIVRGSHVEHWQNGVKLLEYELWSPEWKALVAASKFAKMPGYGLNKTGHLALQDHGDTVAFRDIRIRPLVR